MSPTPYDFLPDQIAARFSSPADAYGRDGVARYLRADLADLYQITEVCLRNLGRIDRRDCDDPLDADLLLRAVLVPELWERMRPGARLRLRRISTTLAEYRGGGNNFFRLRAVRAEVLARLLGGAERMRAHLEHAATSDASELAQQVRFALAGSRVIDDWDPADCVYEPGFTYRLVPVLAHRCLVLDHHGAPVEDVVEELAGFDAG